MNPVDEALLAAVLTWIVGPLIFNIISRIVYSKSDFTKFPINQFDFLTYVVILPVFNAVAVTLGIHYFIFDITTIYALYSFIGATILTSVFVYYMKNVRKKNEWFRPEKGKLNLGGAYLSFYIFIQTYFIFFSIINLYRFIVLWVPVIGFIGLIMQRIEETNKK